jgi:hypothetical protein
MSPSRAHTPITFMMSALYFHKATNAATATMTGNQSKAPANGAAAVPCG